MRIRNHPAYPISSRPALPRLVEFMFKHFMALPATYGSRYEIFFQGVNRWVRDTNFKELNHRVSCGYILFLTFLDASYGNCIVVAQ